MSTASEWADRLLAKMTFEEKVALAVHDFEAVAHLGIPALRYADGPNGIRGPDNVTAFPASLALAATFDERLAAAYGTAVAEEARDTGSNVLLGPAVDIARVPQGGRLPEALGEDPCLAGRLAAAEVRAIQDRHVISMVKHFVGNNAETGRTGYATSDGRTPVVNTVVSERALQELYYPPFKAVVQQGGAGSVMGSYNRVNGTYACQHPGILRTLKQDWGREGFVAPTSCTPCGTRWPPPTPGSTSPGSASPRGGRPSTSPPAPSRPTGWTRSSAGPCSPSSMPASTGTRSATRTGGQPWPAPPATSPWRPGSPSTGWSCCTTATASYRSTPTGSVAVLGTARDDAQWVMAGSPCVRVVPDRRVTFAQGSFGDAPLPTVPIEVLRPAKGEGTGLLGEYWNADTPDGEPALTVVDPTVDLPAAPEGLTAPVWSAR